MLLLYVNLCPSHHLFSIWHVEHRYFLVYHLWWLYCLAIISIVGVDINLCHLLSKPSSVPCHSGKLICLRFRGQFPWDLSPIWSLWIQEELAYKLEFGINVSWYIPLSLKFNVISGSFQDDECKSVPGDILEKQRHVFVPSSLQPSLCFSLYLAC